MNTDIPFPTFLFEFPVPLGLFEGNPNHQMLKAIPARLLVTTETYGLITHSVNGDFGIHLNIQSFYRDYENFDKKHSDGFYLGYRLYCLDIHPYNYLDTLHDIVNNKFAGQGYNWVEVNAPLPLSVYPL